MIVVFLGLIAIKTDCTIKHSNVFILDLSPLFTTQMNFYNSYCKTFKRCLPINAPVQLTAGELVNIINEKISSYTSHVLLRLN